jgi:phage FluMu protein Com
MIIICRNCNKKMEIGEFSGYATTYLIKFFVMPVVIILVAAIKDWLSEKKQTRGFIDGQMAALANNFGIACPKCKASDTPWDPADEMRPVEGKK